MIPARLARRIGYSVSQSATRSGWTARGYLGVIARVTAIPRNLRKSNQNTAICPSTLTEIDSYI
jgi:hypothetical protein